MSDITWSKSGTGKVVIVDATGSETEACNKIIHLLLTILGLASNK